MKKISNIDLDLIGVSASLLCAVHCALVPLILTFGLLSGVSFLANPVWDIVLIGLSVALAMTSLYNGYQNHHKNLRPIISAALGFIALIIGHLLHIGIAGDILSVSGGVAIAFAHLQNYRACRTCKLCRD